MLVRGSDRAPKEVIQMKFASNLVAAAILAGSSLLTAGPVFNVQTIIDPANPGFTQALGINNSGTIAGFSGNPTALGFTLTLPNTFAAENFPAAASTMVTGINQNGDTVGIYVDAGGTTHGFTDIGGTFHTVDQPGTVFNQGLGINLLDETVGYSSAIDPAGMVGQDAYSQLGGVFTSVNALLPLNDDSQAVGINNAGNIVGFYMPTATTSVGFLDRKSTRLNSSHLGISYA